MVACAFARHRLSTLLCPALCRLRHVRNLDRWIHAEQYPELFYPELYLIDGGYKNCFETVKVRALSRSLARSCVSESVGRLTRESGDLRPAELHADESQRVRSELQERIRALAQALEGAQDERVCCKASAPPPPAEAATEHDTKDAQHVQLARRRRRRLGCRLSAAASASCDDALAVRDALATKGEANKLYALRTHSAALLVPTARCCCGLYDERHRARTGDTQVTRHAVVASDSEKEHRRGQLLRECDLTGLARRARWASA